MMKLHKTCNFSFRQCYPVLEIFNVLTNTLKVVRCRIVVWRKVFNLYCESKQLLHTLENNVTKRIMCSNRTCRLNDKKGLQFLFLSQCFTLLTIGYQFYYWDVYVCYSLKHIGNYRYGLITYLTDTEYAISTIWSRLI